MGFLSQFLQPNSTRVSGTTADTLIQGDTLGVNLNLGRFLPPKQDLQPINVSDLASFGVGNTNSTAASLLPTDEKQLNQMSEPSTSVFHNFFSELLALPKKAITAAGKSIEQGVSKLLRPIPRLNPGEGTAMNLTEAEQRDLLANNDYAGIALSLSPSEIAKPLKAAKEEIKAGLSTAKTQLFDRLAPLQELTAGKVSVEKDPYVQARLFFGSFGKVQNRLSTLSQILQPAAKDLPDIKQYALLERYDELANRGITKFPGGKTIDQLRAEKAALEKRLGDRLPVVQAATKELQAYSNTLLTEAKDAGIISEDAYKAIKAKNEKYVPLQRLDYLAEQADNLPRGSNSFSVASQNLVKTIQGSTKEVADPIESIVRNTYKTVNLIERNKVALKVADLAENPAFKDSVIKLTGEVPAGMEKFSVFRNGIKEDYAVPKGVGEALKNMNQQSVDLISHMAKFTGSLLRTGATSMNVAFIPSNIIRDYQTATIVSKVGFTPLDWLKGFAEAISKGEDYQAFLESGASMSGFFEGNKSLPKTVRQLAQGKGMKVLKTITNPAELLRTVGETVELAPRIGVFKRSLRKGLSMTEAAFNARNATVDFAKAGSTMRLVNMWVPFLNARLQGTVNMFSAIKNRPLSSAWKLGAIVGVPVIATYLNNITKYRDIYNDIADYEKRNNFIFIYGDKKDDQGNPTQVVKIPKGDAKVFSNPLEAFLDYLSKNDPKTIAQLSTEMLSDASPVDFEKNGQVSGGTLFSNILPPTIKAGVETVTNQNLYTGRQIVPDSLIKASPEQQYDSKTSPLAKWLGEKLGWSPMKIENFIGTQFAGLGKQLLNPTEAPTTVSGRFAGARGGQQEQDFKAEAEKAVQAQADQKAKMKRRAEDMLAKLEADPTGAAETFDAIAKQDPELAKAIADLKEKKDLGYTGKDYVIEQLGVDNGERAKFLAAQFARLKTDQEKIALWDDLVNKKLITQKVADQMTQLLNTGK